MRINITHPDTEEKAVAKPSLQSPVLLSFWIWSGRDLGTPGSVIIQNLEAGVRNTQTEAQISGWGPPRRRKRGFALGLLKTYGSLITRKSPF